MVARALHNFEVAYSLPRGSATLDDIRESGYGVAAWTTYDVTEETSTATFVGQIDRGAWWQARLKDLVLTELGADYRCRALCESADGSEVF